MVTRVWSRVRSAILNPWPSSPISRSAGISRVVEVELAGGRPLDAELVLGRPEGEAGVAVLDHERGDPVRALVRVGDRHHRVVLRHARVGDPPLHAVEHVPAVRPHGPGPHRAGVGAGLRLREPVGEHRLAPRHRRQVPLLDLLRRAEQQRHGAELVHRRDQRGGGARPRDLLDDERRRQRVAAGAAVGLRNVDRVEVRLDQRLVHVPGELRGPVDLRRPGRDLVVRERADRFAQRLVLFGEFEGAHLSMLTPRHADARST